MDNTKYKCPVKNCTVEYEKLISLSIHYRKYHKGTAKNLYVTLFCNNKEPTCACGCGGEVKFLSISRGFREYIRGHISRVKNNFVCKKAQEGSIKTRRKMIEDGTWKPFALKETGEAWNKGLTKETDQRIRNMVDSIIKSEKKTGAKSKRMKIGRRDGTVRTLHGSEHSQWKGGTSVLRTLIKSSTKLYYSWRFPKLKSANFLCEKCGISKVVLHVHHDKEKMCDILHLVADKYNLGTMLGKSTKDLPKEILLLKTKIIDDVVKYHVENNVSGIVLCKKCHSKEHGNLNF